MPALAVSADGATIFVALEDAGGLPVILKASRDDLATWATAYVPGAGTAANVIAAGDDRMLFYGNFGTDITVVSYVISTATPTDISPAGLGSKVANCAAVNPSNPDEIMVTVDTDQDLLFTPDGGATWDALNSALGFDPTALLSFWGGEYDYARLFIGGNPSAAQLLYSPNEGNTTDDIAGVDLAAVANIVGLEGVERAVEA